MNQPGIAKLIDAYKKSFIPNFEAELDYISNTAKDLETILFQYDPTISNDRSKISENEEMQLLDKSYKETLKQMKIANVEVQTLEAIYGDYLIGGLDLKDFTKKFSNKLDRVMESLDLSDSKLEEIQDYINFRDRIWKIRHPNEEFYVDTGDDDIMMVGSTVQTHCPITQEIMDDPYTSTVCNHSYSFAIFSLVRGPRGGECPVAGCNLRLNENQIKQDRTLARQIRQILKDRDNLEGEDIEGIY